MLYRETKELLGYVKNDPEILPKYCNLVISFIVKYSDVALNKLHEILDQMLNGIQDSVPQSELYFDVWMHVMTHCTSRLIYDDFSDRLLIFGIPKPTEGNEHLPAPVHTTEKFLLLWESIVQNTALKRKKQ